MSNFEKELYDNFECVKAVYNSQKDSMFYKHICLEKLDFNNLFYSHLYLYENHLDLYDFHDIELKFEMLVKNYNIHNLDDYHCTIYHIYYFHPIYDDFKVWYDKIKRKNKISEILKDKPE